MSLPNLKESFINAFKKENICGTFVCISIFLYGVSYGLRYLNWNIPWKNYLLSRTGRAAGVLIAVMMLPLIIKETALVIKEAQALFPGKDTGEEGESGIRKKYRRHLIYALCGFIIFLLIYPSTGMLTLPLIVYYSKEISFKRRMQMCLLVYLAMLVIWMFAFSGGYLDDVITSLHYGIFRSFGFHHSNNIGRGVVFALLAWWYAFGRRRLVLSGILSLVCIGVCWFILGCRTGAVAAALFLVIIIVFEYGTGGKRIRIPGMKTFFTFLPLLLTAGSALAGWFILHVLARGSMVYFGRRFIEIIFAFREYGLRLFPVDIAKTTGPLGFYYMDNTYVWLIFAAGLLCMTGYMIWMCMAGRAAYRYKDDGLLPVLFIVFIYAVMEQSASNTMFMMAMSIMNLPVSKYVPDP